MEKRLLAKTFIISTVLGLLAFSLTSGKAHKANDSNSITWVSIEEAQELIRKQPRKVFIDVYTTWCGPCKLMDRTTFKDEKVREYVKAKYYAVKLNAESTRLTKFKGQEITEKELVNSFQVQGYPTILLMDEDLESLQTKLGYMKAGQFRKLLENYYQNN